MRTKQEVMTAFSPVGKLSTIQSQLVLRTEVAFKDLAVEIMELVPETPDRTAALRKLLESKFTCIQAITHIGATPQSTVSEIREEIKKGPGRPKKEEQASL